jgi:hypothetical protein
MLDTVRLNFPFFPPPGLDDEKWIWRSIWKDDVYVEKYALQTRGIAPNFPKTRVMLYVQPKPKLTVSASFPRLAFGHNVSRLDAPSFKAVVDLLDALVSWGLTDYTCHVLGERTVRHALPVPSPLLPSTLRWYVSRVDLPFDYRPRRVPFKAALKALLSLKPTGNMLTTRIGETTAYHRSPAKRRRLEIAIYDKHAEAKKNNKRAISLAEGLIRLEVRLLDSQTIRTAFRLSRRPVLEDVFDPKAVGRVLLDKLARLDVRPGLESVVTGHDVLSARLGHRAARRLWPFMEMRGTDMAPREVEAMLGISHATALRYMKELRRAGLYTAAVGVEGVIEELVEQIQAWVSMACAASAAPATGGTHETDHVVHGPSALAVGA